MFYSDREPSEGSLDSASQKEKPATIRNAVVAMGYVYLTGVIVCVGVAFGVEFIPRQSHPHINPAGQYEAFGAWDGVWFQRIVANGYDWNPQRESSVAYFPAFPVLAIGIRRVVKCSPLTALLIVSNVSLLLATVLMWRYFRDRLSVAETEAGIISLLLWPMGLFFRCAYSESLFLLLLVLTMLGISRRWPLLCVAALCGAATATRAVGIALLLPVAWDAGRRSSGSWQKIMRLFWIIPLSCWGLLLWMYFLNQRFGNPLVFAQTQKHWSMRADLIWSEKVFSLLTLEPLWSVHNPTSEACWLRYESVNDISFSLQAWNPVYFSVCAGLVIWGCRKRWLTTPEWMLSAGLLLIPYVLQSWRMMMLGHGRFTCVVIPMFLVLGRLLPRLPPSLVILIACLSSMYLFAWSALFASWHRVF